MKNVLVINTVPFRFNGISIVMLNYYEAMSKEDLEMDFFLFSEVDEEIPQAVLDKLDGANIIQVVNRKKYTYAYLKELNRTMQAKHYDVVHIHGNSNTMSLELMLAKLNGIPKRIAHVHNSTCSHKISNKLLQPIMDLFVTDRLACSKLAKDWLFPKRPCIVLNNAIDIKKYEYSKAIRKEYRDKFNLDGKFVVGHIGLVNNQKNHSFLMEIFAEIKKIKKNCVLMLISGSEKLTENLTEKAKSLGIDKDILFLNKRNDVHNLLQAMDVFVFPSLFEGLGLVLIEAQASSLCCVASDAVPPETKVTNLIEYMSLDLSAEQWAKKAISICADNNRETCNVYKNIEKAGYSIYDNSKILRDIYIGGE